jgi:hypothetical protein
MGWKVTMDKIDMAMAELQRDHDRTAELTMVLAFALIECDRHFEERYRDSEFDRHEWPWNHVKQALEAYDKARHRVERKGSADYKEGYEAGLSDGIRAGASET